MSVLADRDLRRRLGPLQSDSNWPRSIGIEPYDESRIQPSSIDLTLANEWLTYPKTANEQGLMIYETPEQLAIDIDEAKKVRTEKTVAEAYLLMPHQLVLFSTAEYLEIPTDLCARIEGKSSIGRLGLLIHCTAGFIDPGFKGKITLEMVNLNNRPILLHAGKSICQLSFFQLTHPAEFPYGHERLGSHYQDQREVTGSRYDGS